MPSFPSYEPSKGSRGGERVQGPQIRRMHHEHTLND
jgi:hypothetical protein